MLIEQKKNLRRCLYVSKHTTKHFERFISQKISITECQSIAIKEINGKRNKKKNRIYKNAKTPSYYTFITFYLHSIVVTVKF